jgi:hypothetical protein
MSRLFACVILAMGAFSVIPAIGQASAGAPPAEPERPRLALIGTVIGKPQNVALVLDQTTKTVVRLHLGEAASGWFLRSVDSRKVTVEKNSQTVTLALPPLPHLQAGPSPVAENRQAVNLPPPTPDTNQLASPLPQVAEPARATPPAPPPPETAPTSEAIAPPPLASTASKQPGDATSAAPPAPLPAGGEDRSGIGASREPAVPVIAQAEPRSGSDPAPPQLQARPSPVPERRQALNLPPAAVIAPPPPEPAAPSGSAPQLLPENAPIRVLVSYAPRSAAARQEAAGIVHRLRGGGLAASDPAPDTRVRGNAGITYFFAEDRDGARRVEHDLGEGFGPSRLSPAARGAPLPRPGTIEVLVPAR